MKGPFSQEQLKKIVLPLFPSPTITPVEKGSSSYTYKISSKQGNFYLSIPRNKSKSLRSQFIGLNMMIQRGALVPKPFYYEDFSKDLDNHSYIIKYEIQGTDIENMMSADIKNILQSAGKSLSIIHSIKLDGFGYTTEVDDEGKPKGVLDNYYTHIAEKVRYEDTLDNKIAVLVDSGVISFNDSQKISKFINYNIKLLDLTQGVMTHGDFNPEHIFANSKGKFTGIIDWDAMTSGSLFYDLAQFSTYSTEEHFKYLLSDYILPTGFKDSHKERLLLERLIYCIGKTAKAYLKKQKSINGYHSRAQTKLIEDIKAIS